MLKFGTWSAALAVALLAPTLAALGQGDPIGAVKQTGSYAGGHGVLLGRDAAGEPVCYVVEQGDSHRLIIGLGRKGAFVRLESPEPRETAPKSPVRVFAGVRQVERGREERYAALKTFAGDVLYTVPQSSRRNFLLVASADPAAFLAVVAAAKDNFLVIEARNGQGRDYVAVYKLDQAAADALVACQRTN